MFKLLIISVVTLFCFLVPGFIIRKTNLVDDSFSKSLSVFTLYVAQVALIIHGFIIPFDTKSFKGILSVFFLSLVSHSIFYVFARLIFKKAPNKIRQVLQFGTIFSNAGYMGIPVISDVFGEEYAVYATVYIVWFNVFAFSLGRYIYTGDRKYISVKEIFINPAVIPIAIGFVIYLTGFGGYLNEIMLTDGFAGQAVNVLYSVLTALKNMVAPASMMIIGAKLATTSFKGLLKDKYVIPFCAVRLLLFPAIMWIVLFVLKSLSIIDKTTLSIVLILSSTPAATATTMFAELYGGDAVYSGKLVSLTTLISLVTMPVVAMLSAI